MKKKIVIVGGVAGGASAAARLRRLNEDAEIIMFERGEHISFANCGLPYHIGEVIEERESLLVTTKEKMHERFNIDVRNNSEVISVDTENKKVKVKSKEKGEYEESYDNLVLSPGAKPMIPNIKGIKSKKIYTLRNVHDTDKIKNEIDKNGAEKAVVIGGGFIGIEMAENLKERNIDVTLVEAGAQILAPMDKEISNIALRELNDNGISVILNDGVAEFSDKNDKIDVKLSSGKIIEADMVILSIGVKADTEFLKGSNIKLSDRGYILVSEDMRTSNKDVFAVGDAVLTEDYILNNKVAALLAGPANRQGRIAADNIFDIKSKYKGTLGTAIIKVFELAVACTGKNERTLKNEGIECKSVYIHPMSHASYYKGGSQIAIKLMYNNEDGKILGAQAAGYDGVDKFIDVIATAMKFGGTIDDLAELELAYAPPFLSAKSPANMAGFTAQNEKNGIVEFINPSDIKNYDHKKQILIDVRDDIEFEVSSIEGAINIPVNSLRGNLSKLPKDKEILVYCAVGIRGYIAYRILKENGFKAKNILGGYKSYKDFSYKEKSIDSNSSNTNKTIQKDEKDEKGENIVDSKIINVDACGLSCPGPLMKLRTELDKINEGEIIRITAQDPGFFEDVKAFTNKTNTNLIDIKKEKGEIIATIRKGEESENNTSLSVPKNTLPANDGKTIVVFSGDLDKAIASFIIANGAVAMGKKVTMFFTFWGLNILRKHENVKTKKNLIESAFGFMMPRGSKKLSLSKMNMGGMGAKMIRGVMKNKNIQSLEDLIEAAIKSGVNIVACTMSMDVMGIKEEELIDGVNYGGVGYYLGEADDANVNLFI